MTWQKSVILCSTPYEQSLGPLFNMQGALASRSKKKNRESTLRHSTISSAAVSNTRNSSMGNPDLGNLHVPGIILDEAESWASVSIKS